MDSRRFSCYQHLALHLNDLASVGGSTDPDREGSKQGLAIYIFDRLFKNIASLMSAEALSVTAEVVFPSHSDQIVRIRSNRFDVPILNLHWPCFLGMRHRHIQFFEPRRLSRNTVAIRMLKVHPSCFSDARLKVASHPIHCHIKNTRLLAMAKGSMRRRNGGAV
jgi:hypothetical protein